MRMQTNDGAILEADDPAGLVTAMRQAGFGGVTEDARYMAETAMRVRSMTGASISSANPVAFVRDLVAIGYLKPADLPPAPVPAEGAA